jgi:chorismate mutase
MRTRGIRGAITVDVDQTASVLAATRELLLAMLHANPDLHPEDMASVIFTTTPDLTCVHPAKAARTLGWTQVPLMCAQEISVQGSLPRVIRVLIHWNTDLPQEAIKHVYLREAVQLRPDLDIEAS